MDNFSDANFTFWYLHLENFSVIPIFKSAAEELLNTSGLSPVELLAKALAKTAVSSFSHLVLVRNFNLLWDVGLSMYCAGLY